MYNQGILKGKRILITGISSKSSIAFGIAKAMYQQGANLAFSCKTNKLKNKISLFSSELGSSIVIPCDVDKDQDIKDLFKKLSNIWINFDGFVHSIAYAEKCNLHGDFIDTISKDIFQTAHNISSYSFIAMAKECKKMLNKNASLVTLTYEGSQKVIPYYNIMGLAKASLEANVRYMAYTLGENMIRVNAISAGPISTTSSYSIKDFKKIFNFSKLIAPMRKLVTSKEIGNTAAFLCSDLSKGITGQVIYVDGGVNISKINIS
ncbi:SDR family oxidoreductase [Buchnera aphidicola (Formosaphis micheliae)]|uniref:enoyl-ACP reductase FabI n=1 Tax=Buchnera aphidicola TaxID=9 RepID=UPI0031CC53D6